MTRAPRALHNSVFCFALESNVKAKPSKTDDQTAIELNFVHRRKRANTESVKQARGIKSRVKEYKGKWQKSWSYRAGKSARLVAWGGHVSESGRLTLSFTRVHFVSAFRYACARIRVSVRPFVFAFVTRALVRGRIAGSSHEKKRAEREKKKEKKRKKENRAREAARAWKRMRGDEGGKEKERSVEKISERTRKLEKERQAARTSLARVHKS